MKFSEAEMEKVKTHFMGRTKISLAEAREFLKVHPDISRTAKQIQDKVKQLLALHSCFLT